MARQNLERLSGGKGPGPGGMAGNVHKKFIRMSWFSRIPRLLWHCNQQTMMYLLSLSFTTHRRKAPVLPGPFAAPGRKWEFTKSSWAGHEIAAFVFYDAIVAQLQHVSPISPSPFTTHRWTPLANRPRGSVLLRQFFPVYQMSTKKAVNPLRRRRLTAFHILGRLPDVYQFNFFTSEGLLFRRFPPVLQSPDPMQGSWHKPIL